MWKGLGRGNLGGHGLNLCVVSILFKFFIYLLGIVKDFIRPLDHKKIKPLALGICFVCERRNEEMEKYCTWCYVMENG